MTSVTRSHSASESGRNRMVTLYGVGRLPCTRAATPRAPTSSFTTCPLRAYERPRDRRIGSTRSSSAASQRPAHQVCPNLPRCVTALIPFAGRRGGVYSQSPQSLPPPRRRPSVRPRLRLIGARPHAASRCHALHHGAAGSVPPQREQLAHLRRAHLGDPRFAGPHNGLRKRHFPFDQLVERLL